MASLRLCGRRMLPEACTEYSGPARLPVLNRSPHRPLSVSSSSQLNVQSEGSIRLEQSIAGQGWPALSLPGMAPLRLCGRRMLPEASAVPTDLIQPSSLLKRSPHALFPSFHPASSMSRAEEAYAWSKASRARDGAPASLRKAYAS